MSLLGNFAEIDFSQFQSYCFLPHHGVLKQSSSTTKLRTVFNGSCKTRENISLNDCLYAGKNLLPNLASLLVNWMKYRYAFTADIKQMFRQIIMHENDRVYQLILWRFSEDQPIQVGLLNSVSYGIKPSPYQANRVIKQLGEDEKQNFPLAAEILNEEVYMDDTLSGSHTIDLGKQKISQVIQICKVGGFELRKWAANDVRLLEDLPPNLLAADSNILFEEESHFAILGMSWCPNSDEFQFLPKTQETPVHWTKRKIASKIAQLFDPLGLLGPIVVSGRIIMRQLWIQKLQWDDPLPVENEQVWSRWYEELATIAQIRIPRWLGYNPDAKSLQIHGFADASQVAYGSSVYLRIEDSDGIKTQLIIARSRVAPIKLQTIPKLELAALRLLAELIHNILPLFHEERMTLTLWTDSKDVLHWLSKHPSAWETFVANRCSQIFDLVPNAVVKHVPTDENPADIISRGCRPSELKTLRLWWAGPPWLQRSEEFWPEPLLTVNLNDSIACHQAVANSPAENQAENQRQAEVNFSEWFKLLQKKSTLHNLLRSTAYYLRIFDIKFIQ